MTLDQLIKTLPNPEGWAKGSIKKGWIRFYNESASLIMVLPEKGTPKRPDEILYRLEVIGSKSKAKADEPEVDFESIFGAEAVKGSTKGKFKGLVVCWKPSVADDNEDDIF